jgi:branched-chain amino acid transport system ATP-binding protein
VTLATAPPVVDIVAAGRHNRRNLLAVPEVIHMTALAVHNLEKSFGGLRVTAAVNLAVEPGERRLIIGPNGAGKTTLFNLITGELRPDGGTIALFDRDITRVPSRQRPHLGIARTYQIITLFPGETLLRNVTLSLLGLSRVRWNPLVRLDRQGPLMAQARQTLAQVALDDLADRPLAQTAYGERRRVEIAMALAQKPRVLLLDEPFAGLSIEERRDVLRLVTGIPREVTIVMIEHDMDVALDFAERITVLHFGQVVVEGTRAEVVAHPRTREIYLGE